MGARTGLLACIVAAGMAVAIAGRAEAAGTGAGMFVAGNPMPMVDASVEIDVRLGVARGVVRQRFHNPRPDAVEAVYVFPLPTGATVDAMSAQLGGATIQATIARRADASQRYEAAVAGGRAAALTEAERPGVFTQSIAPVPAGGDVEITLRWHAALVRRDGTWELAHPLVVGPRYVPGAATGKPTAGTGVVPDTDRAPDASRVTPPSAAGVVTPYQLAVALDDADAITSPTHALAIERRDGGARVVLADARGDREVVLRWTSRKAAQVRAIVEPSGPGAYVAVLVELDRDSRVLVGGPAGGVTRFGGGPGGGVTPPGAGWGQPAGSSGGGLATARRRWIVAIDRSPSLDGAAAAAARKVAHALLDGVGADEPVTVIAIGEAVAAGAERRDRAATRRAIDTLPAGGGDLTRGLAATLANLPRDPAPEIVLVTDGLVADDAAAIQRAVAAGVRVHTVGVGAAPNRWLLGAIAARTGATAGVVSSVDDAAAVATAIVQSDRAVPVTVDWRSPAVSDVEASDPRVAPGGATLLVAFDPTGVPRGEVVVAIGSRKLRAPIVAVAGASLAATWAGLRVRRLYATGDREGATRLALERGVISPTTALYAVVAATGDPVRSTISVPVPLPAGTRRAGVLEEQRDGGGGEAVNREADDGDLAVESRAAPPPPDTGTATGATRIEAGEDEDHDGISDDRAPADAPRTMSLGGGAGTSDDAEAVFGGERASNFLVASLAIGARLDRRAPAALLSVGAYRRLPRSFAGGLRLDLSAAPTIDDPITAAGLFSLSSRGLGLLRVDGGVGVGWDGDLGAAYQLGLFAGRHGVGLSLRLSGLAGVESRTSTLGLGVEAAF